MKIGILTYHFANNYGAALQAYSMQYILSSMGHDVEFVDFCSVVQRSNNSLIEKNNSISNCFKNIVRLPHYFSRKKRIENFNNFREKFFVLSKKRFISLNEMRKFCENEYDAIIVGSDQVWNPRIKDFDEIYFMISDIKIPVYAYAVSLGNAKEDILLKYKKQILNFKRISVREEASIEILKKIDSKINSIGVVDPTLLPNKIFFENIAKPIKKNKEYIICYFLGRKNTNIFRRVTKELANKFDLDIYYINANNGITSYKSGAINSCGPEEFLGYLKNAKFVCTNSFHAVALSIQFNTPFFTFETDFKDTRKRDLLKRLNLLDRVVENFDISHINNYKLRDDINIEENLLKYQKTSFEFLKEILK